MTNFDAVPVDPLREKLFGVRDAEPYSAGVSIIRAVSKETISRQSFHWGIDYWLRGELMAGLEPRQVREIAFITAERIIWADEMEVILRDPPPGLFWGHAAVAAAGETGQTELDLHLSGVDQFDPLEEGKRVGKL